jgi:hypothetical protein
VNLFKEAIERSPGKHIDVVVANAGIGESDSQMFLPEPSLGESRSSHAHLCCKILTYLHLPNRAQEA